MGDRNYLPTLETEGIQEEERLPARSWGGWRRTCAEDRGLGSGCFHWFYDLFRIKMLSYQLQICVYPTAWPAVRVHIHSDSPLTPLLSALHRTSYNHTLCAVCHLLSLSQLQSLFRYQVTLDSNIVRSAQYPVLPPASSHFTRVRQRGRPVALYPEFGSQNLY